MVRSWRAWGAGLLSSRVRARQSVDKSRLCRGGRSRLARAVLASATTRGEVGGSRRRRIRERPNSHGRASNAGRVATSRSPRTLYKPANTSSRPGGISRSRRQRLQPASCIEHTGPAASTPRWGTVRYSATTQWHERGRWHRAHPGVCDVRAPRVMQSAWGRPGSDGDPPPPGRRGRQRHARSLA